MSVLILLGTAMLVAIIARRLSLPYTIGLVLVGVAIAFIRPPPNLQLTHDFIFFVILPPLLFEASIALPWRALKADSGPLLLLSTGGTLIGAAIVAFGMMTLLHWSAPAAFIFGALIAATDPVAVIAMFKDNGVGGRLRTLLEGESLFNDAAAAILFSLALAFASGDATPSISELGWRALYAIGGGAGVGALTGGLTLLIAGRAREHTVEVALTILAAYGSFFISEQLHVSGILSTVVAGLIIGNVGLLSKNDALSQRAQAFAHDFWDFAAFLANSAVFPLIGIALGGVHVDTNAAASFAIAVAVVLVARAVTVYPLSLLFAKSPAALPIAFQHVLWWGGLRGALGLALVLSLPVTLPFRDVLIATTFAVVAFSIIVQGLTMPPLLKALGLSQRRGASAVE